jgi:hypothetical protein
MEINGVRVTTPLRTALDLAAGLGPSNALAVLDGFMRVHGLTHQALERELPRYSGRRGVVQLRRLIPLADARSESPGESWTRYCIIDAGLPSPEPQVWVMDRGRKKYRLDLAYRRHQVAIEFDGQLFHDDERARAADGRRRDWLRAHGWIVIVVTKDSFTPAALDEWLLELRQALRRR